MQRFNAQLLFGALLLTGTLAAQTPAAPDTTKAPAAPAQAPSGYDPNKLPPGMAGPAPQPPGPQTREEQEAEVKARADHMAELQVNAFARQLNLTPAQVVRLRPILADRQKEMRALVVASDTETPAAAAERTVKVEQIQKTFETRIKLILDPIQRAQYERALAIHQSERTRRAGMAAANRRARLGAPPAAPVAASGSAGAPAAPPAAPAAAAPSAPSTPAAPPAPAAPPQSK